MHLALGNYTQLVSLSANLISGYNRDLQDSKKPFFETLEITLQCLQVTKLLVSAVTVNHEKIQLALTPELFATHYALDLVKNGAPFREAYQQTAKEHKKLKVPNLSSATSYLADIQSLSEKVVDKQLKKEQRIFKQENQKYQKILTTLLAEKGKHEKKD